jgi:hypothetical protein
MIKDICVSLAIVYIIFNLVGTVCIAFMSDLMCRNRIAPIDYIIPVRVVGCWLGDHPMQSKGTAE